MTNTSIDLGNLWENDNGPIVLDVNKIKQQKLLEKINNPKEVQKTTQKIMKSKNVSTKEKLILIEEEVMRVLGHFKPNTLVVHSREELHNYIDKAIANGIIAIDTETNNSLDPITCKLMGGCIYTPNEKNCYIPVNHRDPNNKERLEWQLTEQDIREEFQRLLDNNVYMIWHNGKFDYKVIYCTCGIKMSLNWDTMIGAKILNENEQSATLKFQYRDKIDKEQEKYDIEHLFSGVEYADVDPELFALYAATDAYETYKLYEWQISKFNLEENKGLLNLAINVEMPCVEVVSEMELNGVELDQEYAKRLKVKYHNISESIVSQINKELKELKPTIDAWRLTEGANLKEKKISKDGKVTYAKSKNEQLEENINIGSPTQLSILLYDVLGVQEGIDKKSPRGTGTDILEKIDLPICKYLIEYREVDKLLTSFIDALPQQVNPRDGRIHCSFNQYGADTGRFSSSEPNLQQIPSHNKEIRMLFKASDGYTLIGSDYSQQEPRLLSVYSKDDNMTNAYKQGKDLYATIASGVYHNTYWDNMENHQDGTPNPEGKKRRSSCKSLLLGIMYGRGVASIAEQIKGTIEEAQGIIDNFYKSFPKVKNWIDKTVSDAKKTGYVEDLWGRRRRLPDLLLPKYEITYGGKVNSTFNPFLNCIDRIDNKVDNQIKGYIKKLEECKYKKEVDTIKQEATKNGFKVVDNGAFISKAERQCVNARIQGGSATMTKIAMNKLYRNEELRSLGFKLLIGVHDELIGECPKENIDRVEELFTTIMKTAIRDMTDIPFKCDADICDHWYYNDYCATLKSEIETLKIKNDISYNELFEEFAQEHCEMEKEELRKILEN